MKLRFNVDLVVDDKFVEQWKNNTISYYELLYEGDQEKIKKTMEENTFGKAMCEDIWDNIMNQDGMLACNVVEINNLINFSL